MRPSDRPLLSRAAQAHERLKHEILTGSRLPGDRVREKILADEYGVSQTTIRQVLFQLEGYGLVARTPDRGTAVTILSRRELLDRIDARVPLEALAWQRAARKLTAADYVELEALAERLLHRNEYEVDYRFHALVWERSGNSTLRGLLEQLVLPMLPIVNLARGTVQDRRARAAAHRDILARLKRHDSRGLPRAAREHVEGAYRFFGSEFRDSRELMEALLRRRRRDT